MALTADAWYLLRSPATFDPGPERVFGKPSYLSLNEAMLTGEREPVPDPGAFLNIRREIMEFLRQFDRADAQTATVQAKPRLDEWFCREVEAKVNVYRLKCALTPLEAERAVARDMGLTLDTVGEAVQEARWMRGD